MITSPDASSSTPGYRCNCRDLRSLSWGAILAGAVGSLAIHILLMMLGAGLGLALYDPITSENPVANPGTGAVVIQGVAAVLSLWIGGWIAGRFGRRHGPASGLLYGFMVWCVATVTAIGIVSTSAGWALGNLSSMVGSGLSMAGQTASSAVSGVTDMAEEALGQESDLIESFLEEGLSTASPDQSASEAIRAKRDLGLALTRLAAADADTQAEREQQVVTLLVENQNMREAEARQMVDNWTATYEALKTDLANAQDTLATQAREIAEETADTLAMLALIGFVSFVIGGIAASFGGKHGCMCAAKDDGVVSPQS